MTYRLMPETTEFSFDGFGELIKQKLPAGSELKDSKVVPVAFGLNSFEVMIVATDAEGVSENVESALSSITGIQSVEAKEITLL